MVWVKKHVHGFPDFSIPNAIVLAKSPHIIRALVPLKQGRRTHSGWYGQGRTVFAVNYN